MRGALNTYSVAPDRGQGRRVRLIEGNPVLDFRLGAAICCKFAVGVGLLFLGLAAAPGTAMAAGPVFTTDPATSITSRGATMNGTIDPQGSQVLGWYFEYGPSSSAWCMNGGTSQAHSTSPVSSFPFTDSHPVSFAIDALTPNTMYCYRLVVSGAPGSFVTFTTGPAIPATVSIQVIGPGSVEAGVTLADGSFDPSKERIQCSGEDAGPEGRGCTLHVLEDDPVTLHETPAIGSGGDGGGGPQFAGWSGACSGTSGACHLTISGDTTVGATFTSGSPPPPPSAAAVDHALAAVLTPSGPAASIAAVLKAGSYPAAFQAPGAGKAQIAWYQGSPSARIARAQKSLLVAKGAKTFTEAGKATIKIKLTPKGKALLGKVKKGQKLALSAKGSFTPEGGKKTSKQKSFTLKG
jgi:hypothetical protein